MDTDQNEQNATISIRKKIFNKLSKHPNIFIIYKVVAIVLVWSGIWGLSDELIFPDNPILRYCIILVIGMFLLWIDDYSLDELTDVPKMGHEHAVSSQGKKMSKTEHGL